MKAKTGWTYFSAALLFLCGCQPDLTLQKARVLQPGTPTSRALMESYGKPRSSVTENSSYGSFELTKWIEIPPRTPWNFTYGVSYLAVETHNNVVNGYLFTSNMGKETTTYDEKLVPMIVPGKSTRDDVTRLLGQPHGQFLFPSITHEVMAVSRPGTRDVWAYTAVETGFAYRSVSTRCLYIAFDKSGKVQNVLVTKSNV